MPATPHPPGTPRPAYHARSYPDGSWQLRVFNLPPASHPWVSAVLATPLGEAVTFHKGVEGKQTVVRVRGSKATELASLIKLLAKHAIPASKVPGSRN